jgi:hypothetical protein
MNKGNRDRKKEWKSQQSQLARAAFPMTDLMLESSFASVEAQAEDFGCDHSHRFTKQWNAEDQRSEVAVLAWLKDHGGSCDREVWRMRLIIGSRTGDEEFPAHWSLEREHLAPAEFRHRGLALAAR